MKHFRGSISALMALVLALALDFGACKSLLGGKHVGLPYLAELIVFGALPMANILAVVLFRALGSRPDHRARRQELAGFLAFGTMAMLLSLGAYFLAPCAIHEGLGAVLKATRIRSG